MASQVLIRTEVAGTGAQYALTQASPAIPFPVSITAAHLYEPIDQIPGSGVVQPGGNPRFDLSLEVDLHMKESLFLTLSQLTLAGGATFARFIDGIGLWAIQYLQAQFGTERIQTVYPNEVFVKLEQWYDDEMRTKLRSIMLMGLTPTYREAHARFTQDCIVPFLTLLGLSFGSDPSQNIFVRGLGEKLQLRLQMQPANMWVESDVALPGSVSEASSTWVVSSSLLSDCQHILDDERAQLEAIYSGPRRYVFDEVLYSNVINVPGTTPLPSLLSGGQTMRLNNISEPVNAWVILFQWHEDLVRVAGGAGGTRGYDPTNISGWYNAGGDYSPCVSQVGISVGSNAFYWKTQNVSRLLDYEKARSFKSSGGQAMIVLSYAWDPTRPNTVFGFVDPSQTDVPQLIVQLVSPFNFTTGAASGAATLADVENHDIGQTGGSMDITVFAFCKNQINFDNYSMFHPIN